MTLRQARILAIPMLGAFGLMLVFLYRSEGADWNLVQAMVSGGLAGYIGIRILQEFHRQDGWPEDDQ